jgi:hypothetical protein
MFAKCIAVCVVFASQVSSSTLVQCTRYLHRADAQKHCCFQQWASSWLPDPSGYRLYRQELFGDDVMV